MALERRYWIMTNDGPVPSTIIKYTEPIEPIPKKAWCINSSINGGFPYTSAIPSFAFLPYTPPEEPIPNTQWRIDGRTNDGYPYNMLIPFMEYVPRRPDPFNFTKEYDYIDLYDYVQIVSAIHGIRLLLPVTRQEIHFDDPKSTTYTIGRSFRTANNSLSYILNSEIKQLPKRRYF